MASRVSRPATSRQSVYCEVAVMYFLSERKPLPILHGISTIPDIIVANATVSLLTPITIITSLL